MSAPSSIGRARRRPPHVKAPAYLSKSPPMPQPGPPTPSEESGGPRGREPTRYGDWESKGICRDF
ncbi:MAG TPA: DUF1674 domain-containing protein [Allosphingosinicella sp.]|nr:DUF1674 domain-containing protein [Allosphingosinicella sp.]